MSKIKVSHSELGTITAEPVSEIDQKRKHAIKSLACLQIVCMTPTDEVDENFDKFLDIIAEAAHKAEELYKEETENAESSSIKQF